jgi:hypothetical protein
MLLELPRLGLSGSRRALLSGSPRVLRVGAAEVDTQLSAVDLLLGENLLGCLSTGNVDEVGMAETSGLT